jgi:YtkA-like
MNLTWEMNFLKYNRRKKMKPKISLAALALSALFFASCGGDLSNLKVVQEQTTGNFKVSVLNEDGAIKQGSGKFVVEFRDGSNNQLVKAGSVSSEAVMQMAGMPMTGETSIDFTDIPGRYNAKYNFPMKGNWIYTVYFNLGLKVTFNITVM